MVDCAINPYKCGGVGGCHGAVVEIGFHYA